MQPCEIILIGGASILANYGFRDMTYDMDAVILASSVMIKLLGIAPLLFAMQYESGVYNGLG